MRRYLAWIVVGACALLIIGLIAYARGQKHHEGDTVGSHGTRIFLITKTGGEQPSTPTEAVVADLQELMTRLGYYTGPIDGVYSEATTAAVTEMQKALGVTADGVYGPETEAALKQKGKDVVVQVQTALTEYGYYTGEIDGDYGAATQDAVKKLQSDLGVTVDGKVGQETVDAFNKAVADGTIKPVATTTTTTTSSSTTDQTTTASMTTTAATTTTTTAATTTTK
jgi:peptidoglycan hydrolase-like protein with peptidoglycan-binding domain